MTQAESDPRAALLSLRAQTLGRIGDLRALERQIIDASDGDNADDEHDPEGQTIAWDRAQTAALVAAGEQQLGEVDAALSRLEAGWDGRCEVCRQPIPPERLQVRPTASRCVPCASRGRGVSARR